MFARKKAAGCINTALDWYSSPTLSTAAAFTDWGIPLSIPPRNDHNNSVIKLPEKPMPILLMPLHNNPIIMTPLRPILGKSAARPHRIAVATVAAEQLPRRIPALREIAVSDWLESKERI